MSFIAELKRRNVFRVGYMALRRIVNWSVENFSRLGSDGEGSRLPD